MHISTCEFVIALGWLEPQIRTIGQLLPPIVSWWYDWCFQSINQSRIVNWNTVMLLSSQRCNVTWQLCERNSPTSKLLKLLKATFIPPFSTFEKNMLNCWQRCQLYSDAQIVNTYAELTSCWFKVNNEARALLFQWMSEFIRSAEL